MDRTLFVIVGAGASHDASSKWRPQMPGFVQPPLVKQLFDPSHNPILAKYPLAQSAAPEIRDAMEHGHEGQAISLETHLRETYRDSDDPYDKRRFFSIALYLQDLLWQASKTDHVHFDNTDRLVTTLLRHFDHVCFITLNYDTLLDQALDKLDSLSSMDHYIGYGRWSLIKLHGSVNWGYRPIGDVSVDEPPANLTDYLDTTEIHLAEQRTIGPIVDEPPRWILPRGMHQTKTFPALTVPVGEEDEVVCPELHQDFLDNRLAEQGAIDLLVLGYSAYDKTVLERLARSQKAVRTLTVVNEGADAADRVVSRLKSEMPQSLNGTAVEVSDSPFGGWCRHSLGAFALHHPALA